MKKYKSLIAIAIALASIFLLSSCVDKNVTEIDEARIIQKIENIDKDRGDYKKVGINEIYVLDTGEAVLRTTGDLKVLLGDNYVAAMGVKKAYIEPLGNEGYRSVIFLLENGTVSSLDSKVLADKNDARLRNNVGDLKDIESIEVSSEAGDDGEKTIYAVDSKGEKHNLTKHLK